MTTEQRQTHRDTPEPTTEQVSAYRDYLHYSHPHGRFVYDENAAVAAAIAFVRACLHAPPPGRKETETPNG